MWPSISQLRRPTRAGRPGAAARVAAWRPQGRRPRRVCRWRRLTCGGGRGALARKFGLPRAGQSERESSEVHRSQKRKMKRPVFGKANSLLYYLNHCGARVRDKVGVRRA